MPDEAGHHDAAHHDDAGSLSNADLAPVKPGQRTWSTWNIAALWIGMVVQIPTYTIAAEAINQGMNWWQATFTVLLGNLIVLVPMILNGHGGTKYGVPFPVLIRASFGTVGAHIPSIARGLVACGWFGIQSWIGGSAIYTIAVTLGWIDPTGAMTLPVLHLTPAELLCFLLFWAINLAIILAGIESIRWLESFAAPVLLAAGIALLVWALMKAHDKGQLAAVFSSTTSFPDGVSFWHVFFPQLTAMVGFWATLSLNIPDFTRYARSQRSQVLGQVIGLPSTMTLFCLIGIFVTAASPIIFGQTIGNPVTLVGKLDNTTVIVISMIMLSLATLSTNLAANVVSPANGFSNVAPRRISFRTGALITCAIGVVIFPWRLYEDLGNYIFVWLIGYSALLGPIAGIMLCDYFVLRRTRLDRDALYDPRGPYRGINRAAMAAVTVAVLPNLPGFTHAAAKWAPFPGPIQGVFDAIYTYAWFVGFAIAFILYACLRRGRPWNQPPIRP